VSITNWAGNVTFRAARVHRPGSVSELRDLVARTPRLHALGSGHSFSTVADSPGDLVSLAGLPPEVGIDPDRGQVRVAGGVRYAELAVELDARRLAVRNLASLPHITVAGAIATGTHGSGDQNAALPTSVAAIELVTADGDLLTIGREDPRFPGAVVALGALGVVVSLTLDVVPAFAIRQWVYDDLPRESLDAHFAEIFASAYSVSAFTTWRDRNFQVWVKHLADDGFDAPPDWLGATLAPRPRHPVPGMPAEYTTPQAGAPGPWYERLPHFRPEYTPSNGDELQTEYLLPRTNAIIGLGALDDIADLIAPLLRVCEVRTVAADGLWLSPCYRRDTVGFHFTWRKEPAAVTAVLPLIEERLAPLGARPHWGKVFTMAPAEVRDRYPRAADFVRLARGLDPAGKFRNAFIDSYFP
jgi:alditol oxidase